MVRMNILKRSVSLCAASLVVVGCLSSCSAASPTAAEAGTSYLSALASGDSEALAELSGLTTEDPSISALSSASERISSPTVLPVASATASPSKLGDSKELLNISYMLGGELVTTTLAAKRAAGEGSPWLIEPPTELLSSPGESDLLSFKIGGGGASAAEMRLLPGVYPVEMAGAPYVHLAAESVAVRDESAILEASFDTDKFESDANALIEASVAECLAGLSPSAPLVSCSGEWGAPALSELSDADLKMGPDYRSIEPLGDVASSSPEALSVTGDPLSDLPALAMSLDSPISTTQDLLVVKDHPIRKDSKEIKLDAVTDVTADVSIGEDGTIKSIELSGDRSYSTLEI